MSRECSDRNEYGKCGQFVSLSVDKSETNWVDWLTGRQLPWGGGDEVIQLPMHPLKQTRLCYYHTKKIKGLYDVINEKVRFHQKIIKARVQVKF